MRRALPPVASLRDFYAFERHVKTCRAQRGLDMVPAWYEVLSNHSQVHAFFTYRSVPAAVGVVVAASVLAAVPRAR